MSKNSQENNVFQTGSTQPPRSYRGLLAVLLVTVLLLGGAVSGLSILNIQLFQQLEESRQEEIQPEPDEVAFVRSSDPTCASVADMLSDGIGLPEMGMMVQEFSDVLEVYKNLPQGLYVLQVEQNSLAHRTGFQSGDVLVALNGTPITGVLPLTSLLQDFKKGETMSFTVVRDNICLTLTLRPEA